MSAEGLAGRYHTSDSTHITSGHKRNEWRIFICFYQPQETVLFACKRYFHWLLGKKKHLRLIFSLASHSGDLGPKIHFLYSLHVFYCRCQHQSTLDFIVDYTSRTTYNHHTISPILLHVNEPNFGLYFPRLEMHGMEQFIENFLPHNDYTN